MSNQDQVTFSSIKDSAQQSVRANVDNLLQKKVYNSREAQTWTNFISEACVKSLTELSKNFKFIISTLIVQKANCGLNISGSCFWDSETDGNFSIMWENASMVCIVNVTTSGTSSEYDNFVNGKYRILKKIGSGSFGDVFKGQTKSSGEYVAIKIEKQKCVNSLLKHESMIYCKLQGMKAIPTFFWYGAYNKSKVLVTELLGKDLSSYIKIFKQFSIKTVYLVGIQLIEALTELHSRGIIHRDLKPENIVMGRGEKNKQIYLIDFGISKPYLEAEGGAHIEFKKNKQFIGTTRYASIASHSGLETSRKDDIESLGYILIYFLRGELPWQNLNYHILQNDVSKNERVGNMKKIILLQELCKGLPDAYFKMMEYIRSLEFTDQPNYSFLFELFQSGLTEMKEKNDLKFDWAEPLKIEVSKFQRNNVIRRSLENMNLIASLDKKRDYLLLPQDNINISMNSKESKNSSLMANFSRSSFDQMAIGFLLLISE